MNEYSDTHYTYLVSAKFQFIINDEFKSLIPSVKHTFPDSIFNIRQTKLCIIYLINVVHDSVLQSVWCEVSVLFYSLLIDSGEKQRGR